MHFKIHGQGKKNLNGDGLAIWYTKERIQKGLITSYSKIIACSSHVNFFISVTGPVFGNRDNFTGLGVFVDTYPNEEKQLEVTELFFGF